MSVVRTARCVSDGTHPHRLPHRGRREVPHGQPQAGPRSRGETNRPGETSNSGLRGDRARHRRKRYKFLQRRIEMVFIIGGAILYFVLIVTLGVMTIRKGHWVIFVIGIFLPFFWLIGAVMPSRRASY
jgi:hypothetical protein